ncbi:MAG: endonuclease NucS domain-containing protein [Pseudomonadota bacterium]
MIGEKRRFATRADARLFRYECELQEAVRRQLGQVEAGLVEADGGQERIVATGKIDVLARDLAGHFVVIELKAGPCPHGALEQVLAYSNDLEAETGTPCRAILVAAQFSERIRAAAKRARDISLVTYELRLGLAVELPQPL